MPVHSLIIGVMANLNDKRSQQDGGKSLWACLDLTSSGVPSNVRVIQYLVWPQGNARDPSCTISLEDNGKTWSNGG